MTNKYKLTYDAYYGSGGFCDGGYIYPYPRELDVNDRKEQAFYENYLKEIINSIVSPVFAKSPTRIYIDDLTTEFINNCDNNNTNLTYFNKQAITMGTLLGQAFVVMDNFDAIPNTLGDVIKYRVFPYIYLKLPQDVYSYQTDSFGKLISITFYDDKDENNNQVYKYWDGSICSKFIIVDKKKVTISSFTHNLGVLPVIKVIPNNEILPIPPYYNMAKLSQTIYNQQSELRDLERAQSFSILVVPGIDQDVNVTIGAKNIIFIDSNSSQFPNYIGPDSNIPKTLRESIDSNIKSLLSQANILGSSAIANNNKAMSGTALGFQYMGQTFALNTTANIADTLETNIMKLFNIYNNNNVEYEVKYTREFAPTKTDLINNYNIIKEVIKDSILFDALNKDEQEQLITDYNYILTQLTNNK